MNDSLIGEWPCNTALEREILGYAIDSTERFEFIQSQLTEEAFYHPPHRGLFREAKLYYERRKVMKADLLRDYLQVAKLWDKVGDPVYVMGDLFFSGLAFGEELQSWIDELNFCKLRRDMMSYLDSAIRVAQKGDFETPEELVSEIVGMVDQAIGLNPSLDKEESTEDFIDQVVEHAAALAEWRLESNLQKTGFNAIDDMLGGIEEDSLITIGARTSVGKSLFGCALARNLDHLQDGQILFISFEQSGKEVARRLIAADAMIETMNIKKGMLHDDEVALLREWGGTIKAGKIKLYRPTIKTVSKVRQLVRKHMKQGKIGAIIIDHLLEMESEQNIPNRHQEVSKILRSLRTLNQEAHSRMYLLTQINREAEKRSDKKPTMADLKESGTIEEASDLVLLLHRPNAKEGVKVPGTLPDELEVNIAKNREGPTGVVRLCSYAAYARVQDIPFQGVTSDYE